MDKANCTIYIGQYFTLEWYYDENGFSQAYQYFLSITQEQHRKFLVLEKRMGDFGKISDKTKFRSEKKGRGIKSTNLSRSQTATCAFYQRKENYYYKCIHQENKKAACLEYGEKSASVAHCNPKNTQQ